MSDPAAFLRAILAHPDDDGPRLVYADWLDERGDPRGEFIRVQCELARWQPIPRGAGCYGVLTGVRCRWETCKACDHDDVNRALRARERELEGRHQQEWLSGLSPLFGKGRWAFRRGFVEKVTCTAADWLGQVCPCVETGAMFGCHRCLKVNDRGFVLSMQRLPGHAAALLAATPLRRVRLTTWPDIEYLPGVGVGGSYRLAGHHKLTQPDANGRTPWENLAALEWPGLTFELPDNPMTERYDWNGSTWVLREGQGFNPPNAPGTFPGQNVVTG